MLYGAMNFPIKPVLDELDKIYDLGFDYFELTLDPPYAHYSQVNQQADALTLSLERYKMDVVCHLPTFVYTADLAPRLREVCIDEMIQSIHTAAQLNALKAVLHPSMFSGLAPLVPDKALGLAYQTLEILVEEAKQVNLPLCFENMYPRYHSFYSPDQFKPVFEKYPDLRMTLDTGHANIDDAKGNRLAEFIRQFPDKIGHVHVSDNNGKQDEHLKAGKGTVNFKQFTTLLKESGYNGTITFEIFSPNPDELVASRNKIDRLLQ